MVRDGVQPLEQLLFELLRRRAPEHDIRVQAGPEGVIIRFGERMPTGKGRTFLPFVRFQRGEVSNRWDAFIPDNGSWVRTTINGGVAGIAMHYLEAREAE